MYFLAESNEWMPQSWFGILGISSVLAGAIAWVTTRETRKRTAVAQRQTIEAYEKTIEAQKRLAEETQKITIEQGKILLDAHIKQVETITRERDERVKKCHDLAGDLTAALLKLKEYELKPDYATLLTTEKMWHEERKRFYDNMASQQNTVIRLIGALDNRMAEHSIGLKDTTKILTNLVGHLESTGIIKREIKS